MTSIITLHLVLPRDIYISCSRKLQPSPTLFKPLSFSCSGYDFALRKTLPLRSLVRFHAENDVMNKNTLSDEVQAAVPQIFQGLPGQAQLVEATMVDSRPISVDEARTGCASDFCYGVGHILLGIDIGGTTIKAAPVDTRTGKLVEPRHVIDTPQPATPEAVAGVIKEMCDHFQVRPPPFMLCHCQFL